MESYEKAYKEALEREEGLRETIKALDERLQKANESGMHYFDQCNIQKQQLIEKACKWIKNNIHNYYMTNEFEQWFDEMVDDFKEAMKGE